MLIYEMLLPMKDCIDSSGDIMNCDGDLFALKYVVGFSSDINLSFSSD
jgi:hypothetical protein